MLQARASIRLIETFCMNIPHLHSPKLTWGCYCMVSYAALLTVIKYNKIKVSLLTLAFRDCISTPTTLAYIDVVQLLLNEVTQPVTSKMISTRTHKNTSFSLILKS